MTDFVCAYCDRTDSRVSDVRSNGKGGLRRRRKCPCGAAFTTYEITKEEYDRLSSRDRIVAILERAKNGIEREITLLTDD